MMDYSLIVFVVFYQGVDVAGPFANRLAAREWIEEYGLGPDPDEPNAPTAWIEEHGAPRPGMITKPAEPEIY